MHAYMHACTHRTAAGNWSNDLFDSAREELPQYALFDLEWAAQRRFNYPLPAHQEIGWRAQGRDAVAEWEQFYRLLVKRLRVAESGVLLPPFGLPTHPWLKRTGRQRSVLESIRAGGEAGVFVCGNVQVSFNSSDGSMDTLAWLQASPWSRSSPHRPAHRATAPSPAHNWADKIGRVRYQTFREEDFERFNEEYTPGCVPCDDFAKVGMNQAEPHAAVWEPSLAAASLVDYASTSVGRQCHFILELKFVQEACSKYGAPVVALHYHVPGTRGAAVDIGIEWREKRATRLAEAIWLSFDLRVPALSPSGADSSMTGAPQGCGENGNGRWEMHVLNSWQSPYDFVANGSRHIHAVQHGVRLTLPRYRDSDPQHKLGIQTLDAPILSFTDVFHLLRYDGETSAPRPCAGQSTSVHWNLYNNVWVPASGLFHLLESTHANTHTCTNAGCLVSVFVLNCTAAA